MKLNETGKLNLLIYFIGNVLMRGINYLATPIFTRIMTKEEYGVFSLFITWSTVISIFIGCQIAGTIPSAKVKYNTKEFKECLHNGILLSIVSFIIWFVLAMVFEKPLAVLLQFQDMSLIPFLMIVAYGKSMANMYSSYTIQMKQPGKNVTFSVSIALVSLLLGIIAVLNMGVNRYHGKVYAETLVYGVVIVLVAIAFCDFKHFSVNVKQWKYLIGLSCPLIIHLLSTNIISQSDRIFITAMLGYEENAVYSVAYSVGMLGIMAVEVCFNVWTPWFFEKMKAHQKKEIVKTAEVFIIFIAIVFSVLILFSLEIYSIMAPENYAGGGRCVIIVAIASFFNFCYRLPMCYEQYIGKLNWVARATILATIVNLVLNYFFIKFWGIEGAAIATVIATMILWIIHESVARKIIGNFPIAIEQYFHGLIIVILSSLTGIIFYSQIWVRLISIGLLVSILLIFLLKTKRKLRK